MCFFFGWQTFVIKGPKPCFYLDLLLLKLKGARCCQKVFLPKYIVKQLNRLFFGLNVQGRIQRFCVDKTFETQGFSGEFIHKNDTKRTGLEPTKRKEGIRNIVTLHKTNISHLEKRKNIFKMCQKGRNKLLIAGVISSGRNKFPLKTYSRNRWFHVTFARIPLIDACLSGKFPSSRFISKTRGVTPFWVLDCHGTSICIHII